MKSLKNKIFKIPDGLNPAHVPLIKKSEETIHDREYLYDIVHIMQKNVWSGNYENSKKPYNEPKA